MSAGPYSLTPGSLATGFSAFIEARSPPTYPNYGSIPKKDVEKEEKLKNFLAQKKKKKNKDEEKGLLDEEEDDESDTGVIN